MSGRAWPGTVWGCNCILTRSEPPCSGGDGRDGRPARCGVGVPLKAYGAGCARRGPAACGLRVGWQGHARLLGWTMSGPLMVRLLGHEWSTSRAVGRSSCPTDERTMPDHEWVRHGPPTQRTSGPYGSALRSRCSPSRVLPRERCFAAGAAWRLRPPRKDPPEDRRPARWDLESPGPGLRLSRLWRWKSGGPHWKPRPPGTTGHPIGLRGGPGRRGPPGGAMKL